jgi:hypothetical protein
MVNRGYQAACCRGLPAAGARRVTEQTISCHDGYRSRPVELPIVLPRMPEHYVETSSKVFRRMGGLKLMAR